MSSDWNNSGKKPSRRIQEDIAVIGLSGLFPGSETLEQFWESLVENRDCRTVAGEAQMGCDPRKFMGAPGEDDSFYCIDGGYINDFVLSKENIPLEQEEIDKLDDVYKWSIYVTREALKDSRYLGKTENLNAGVILGNLSFPTKHSNQLFIPAYHKAINSALIENLGREDLILPRFAKEQEVTEKDGLLGGYPAAMLARLFSLKASSFCLDAACASSLYSVKLACDYLHTGRADLMLAGAVSAADPFFVNLGFSVFHAYPENNISAPLDKRSQGLFAGEGAGMLVLKRYKDALIDGDNIRAVIRGGGLSNDGRGQHVLSPNTKGQMKAFERAYEAADVDPATVEYIECHATGTPLGDKVELTSLENFFTPFLKKSQREAPLIGSVKSNLGHLLTAAGMPAMTKVIMAMDKGVMPASINIEDKQSSPNKVFSEDKICDENQPWDSVELLKRAGVSVFGFGGANAHMVFEQEPKDDVNIPDAKTAPITQDRKMAIVGLDAHFGSSENLAEFEKLVIDDDKVFRELPLKRWRGLEEEELIQHAFSASLPKGGFIERFQMDFLNFKLPPHMEERLIPQQLLLMKVADRAIRDAGLESGGRVAVLVAMGTELELHQIRARVNLNAQFEALWDKHPDSFEDEQKEDIELTSKNSIHHKARLNQYTSAIGNIMASRISSLWDFSGPAFTVSSEENSVFQAVELAQIMFDRGEAESIVVAAVDLSASLESLLLRQQFAQIHKDGNALSFDRNAKGWSVGEGAGAIVLKPEERVENGERVYAQIDGLAFSSTADSQGLQSAAEQVMKSSDINFDEVGYWELCASGFPEQDREEQQAILALAQHEPDEQGSETRRLAIGSVKNNIGHCFAASGIASIIKSALCIHNRVIPGVASWNEAKQDSELWESSTLYIPGQSKPWFKNQDEKSRSAAINSLAMDGRSAFMLMSETSQCQARQNSYLYETESQLFVFRADSSAEILEQLGELKQSIPENSKFSDWASEVYFQKAKAAEGKLCLSLIANSVTQLKKEIQLAETGLPGLSSEKTEWFSPAGSYYTNKPLGQKGKVAFVYPGAFNSYLNIAKDLGVLFPELHEIFAEHSENAATLFADELYYPRSVKRLGKEDEKRLQKDLPSHAISAFENGISVSVALTDVLKNILGVHPDICFGYSMGEVSMMYAHNIWESTDVMSKRLRSNPVFQTRLAGPMETLREAWEIDDTLEDGSFWTGMALLAPVDKVREALENEPFVRLILINTRNESVIAGKPEDCKRVAETLACEHFEAALGDVIHCDWVRPEFDRLSALHILDVAPTETTEFYSAVGNRKLEIDSQGVADNIAEMYCNPVDFVGLTEKVYQEGARIFVELGPRDNCSRYIGNNLANKDHVCIPLNKKGGRDKNNLLSALARLSSHGVSLNLDRLYRVSAKEKKKQLLIDIEVGGERLFEALAPLKAFSKQENAVANASRVETAEQEEMRPGTFSKKADTGQLAALNQPTPEPQSKHVVSEFVQRGASDSGGTVEKKLSTTST